MAAVAPGAPPLAGLAGRPAPPAPPAPSLWAAPAPPRPGSSCAFAAGAVGVGVLALARARRARRAVPETLQDGIANFYDDSTGVWVEIWGEHLHHGYYPPGFRGSLAEHRRAQVKMIEEVLRWAGVPEAGSPGAPQDVLDVGCGVGGSSRHISRKYGCKATGITLSPKQRDQAQELSEASGLGAATTFQVADALHLPFEDNSFDLIWSLESGEHIPNKPQFMSEMHRVCRPGGRIILVTWVHRDLPPGDVQLRPSEQRLLKRISQAYHLPDWCSMADYARIANDDLGLSGVKTADWTANIEPFWGAVIRSALMPSGWLALIRGGWRTFKGALVMPLMRRGYSTGTIKFALLTGTKANGGAGGAGGAARSGVAAKAGGTAEPCSPTGLRPRASLSASPGGTSWGSPRPAPGGAVRRRETRGRCATRLRAAARSGALRPAAALEGAQTIWEFTRPHTLLGTLLSVPAVQLFAANPLIEKQGFFAVAPKLASCILLALVPALLINVYITGMNQIFDVDIDKVNKPYLPIPAGRLSIAGAWATCLVALGLAAAWASLSPGARSAPLLLTLAGSALLGTAYSAPPVRLKRSPFLAAFCIIVVRGALVNLGFYAFAKQALGLERAAGALGLDTPGLVAASFFGVFGLVIALMKDVPDVLGDEMRGVRSLSVRLGPTRVLRWATALLLSLLGGTSAAFAVGTIVAEAAAVVFRRACLSVAALWALSFAARSRRDVDATDPQGVFDFYMDVWRIFYGAYLCLPLVC